MSRDRFLEIKRFLHLADNSKIGNSTDHIDLAIDESMVKYFGGHPAKQFQKGKPVRFGYKNWVLST
ncbi:hypothetical protein NQ318_008131 [Aromia moschata]|uniref:PiggyBac transposable element-derived protein domain-containing protein n=1 Tax=Aromia moschata TaxID=1265417 RepID=A0AAV8YLR0_9CUCU|nr:hypothetical protein NQ318_008131 [Aromia moschata]